MKRYFHGKCHKNNQRQDFTYTSGTKTTKICETIWINRGKMPKITIGRVILLIHQQIIYAGR